MTLKLGLQRRSVRLATLAVVSSACVSYAGVALAQFVIAVASDPQIAVSREMLEAVTTYFPNTARVQARLAARLIEAGVDETQSHEQTAERALAHATRAVQLQPQSYELRLLQAIAAEMTGALDEAETALRTGLELAPYHVGARWRLANLLVRQGKLDESLSEFHRVTSVDAARLPAALELVWQAAEGNLEAVKTVAGTEPQAQLQLAQFLVRQAQPQSAAQIFSRLPRELRLELTTSGQLLDALLAAGEVELAGQLWRELYGSAGELLANGSFETATRKHLAQFDWQLASSAYARVSLSREVARTGQRALRIAYLGVETTRLENEVRQLILVRPGARYRLTAYTKAEQLNTSEGPQLAVTRPNMSAPLAVSAAVSAGSHDWELLVVDFIAPLDARALQITVKQTPQFSFVAPTFGTVWFDDFSLQELHPPSGR